MPVTRADVVREARSWIGTPHMHQQMRKHEGCDCIGLIRGVYRALGLTMCPTKVEAAAGRFNTGYARVPDGVTFKAYCDHFMVHVAQAEMQPGDVIIMRYDKDPQHAAILADYRHGGLSMIHAMQSPRRRVAEHRLDPTWRRRIVAAYSIPGVE